MAEASNNPAKVIDVQDGDRFVAFTYLYQVRGNVSRVFDWMGKDLEWAPASLAARPVDRDKALSVLKLMGYTIRETDRHGREVVARNEVTGNYAARADDHGNRCFGIFNPDGDHVLHIISGEWRSYAEHTGTVYSHLPTVQKYLATAPAYAAAPKPEAGKLIPWPTHCARSSISDAFVAFGTESECRDYVMAAGYGRIAPMPRPPMSAEMRAFVEAVRNTHVRHDGNAYKSLIDTANNLLASEAAK